MVLISSGSKEEMLRMENWLRPSPHIGWNIAAGGGMPPSPAGRILSTDSRRKISEKSKLRVGPLNPRFGASITEMHRQAISRKNGRLFGPHFEGVYIVDGKYFSSSTKAACELNVSKAAIRSRCKKLTCPRGLNGKQSSKNLVSAKEYFGESWIDNFPTWKFISKDHLIKCSTLD